MLVLRRSLERLGHTVESTPDGLSAWERFQAVAFDAVITDWMMPLMDGMELCRRIRASEQESYPYIVVLTAKGQKQDRLEALNQGADDLMVKPLDISELRARLEVAARIIAMQNELQRQSHRMRQLQVAMETSNRRISDLFQRLPIPCVTILNDGLVMEWNLAAEQVFGKPSAEVWMLPLADALPPSTEHVGEDLAQRALLGGSIEPFELRVQRHDGRTLDLLVSTFPLTGPDGDVVGAAIAFVDITERKELEAQIERQLDLAQGMNATLSEQNEQLDRARGQLEQLAATDGLTGLHNYRHLRERMAQILPACRGVGASASLILLDVDHFKQFNDTFGHPEGDGVLKRVAQLIQANVRRSGDIVARYGGEEFSVLLPHASLEQAYQIAEDVRRGVESADWPLRSITVSVGVAEDAGGTDEDLIKAADGALYASKGAGRNRTTRAASPQDRAA